jgi:hypothetical protein
LELDMTERFKRDADPRLGLTELELSGAPQAECPPV